MTKVDIDEAAEAEAPKSHEAKPFIDIEVFRKALFDALGITEEEFGAITPETQLIRDLELDSVDKVGLIMELENVAEITINDALAEEFLGDVTVGFVIQRINESARPDKVQPYRIIKK